MNKIIYVRLFDKQGNEPEGNGYEPQLLPSIPSHCGCHTVTFKCYGNTWIPVSKAVFCKEKNSDEYLLTINLSQTRIMCDGESLMITPNDNALKEMDFERCRFQTHI